MGAFFQAFFRAGLYKRTQGRIARQVTAATLGVIAVIGAWRMSEWLGEERTAVHFGVPALVFAVTAWAAYRIVNWPTFADFLISVEAEMNKVNWPSRGELFRASVVVLAVMFIMAAFLFSYDLIWKFMLDKLHII